MFLTKGAFVGAVGRKVQVSGVAETDYSIQGEKDCIYLHTADVERLTKGKRHVVELTSKLTALRSTLVVTPNPALIESGVVTGPQFVVDGDEGNLVFHITPRVDIDLTTLAYIVRVFVGA